MAGIEVSLDTIFKAIQAAESINLAAALSAVKNGDAGQILQVVEQITDIAADFGVPYANDAKIAEVILGFVIRGYQTGLIRSAEPPDPAMVHAEGRQSGTPAMHQWPVIVLGGTPSDPYAWDARKK